MSQNERAEQFRELHERRECFVIPNPWDAGSAKLMAHHGFKALATTSAGLAFSKGFRDAEGLLSIDEVLSNAADIVQATILPVSADLENGYSNDPDQIYKTILAAANVGLVGGSIEDTTTDAHSPIRGFSHAVDCVRAAAEARNSLSFPFTLTARAENYLYDRPDLDDTIRRLQAFQDAGADVLFAPGLETRDDIAAVVNSLDKPVNVVMGLQGVVLSLKDLSEIGVRRVSLGSSLSRAAFGGLLEAITEIQQHGTFTFSERAVSFSHLNGYF